MNETIQNILTRRSVRNFDPERLPSEEQIAKIELAAYVANMNSVSHPEWNEKNIFDDFLRVLKIDKIDLMKKQSM